MSILNGNVEVSAMKSKPVLFIVSAVLIVSLACITTTKVSNNNSGGQTKVPISSSPFTAEATSPMSVQLAWKPVDGAQKYLVTMRLGDSDFLPVVELPENRTSYEAFPVPDNSEMTYRLQAVTPSTTSDVGTATVTTTKIQPNPLTVQANDYKPIAWTRPTLDPLNPNIDPSKMFPPGFDPNNPESFDPSQFLQQVAASADIGADGGEVTVTTPDNITFTLTVPPGALEDTTTITLTPIESIDNLPFSGGLQGAVRIAPDGLILDVPATLTITRADGSPVPDGMVNLPFTFEIGGQEFHLYPFAPPADTNTYAPGAAHLGSTTTRPLRYGPLGGVSLTEFQSYGIGKGTPQEARSVVQKHSPSATVNQVVNQVAYVDDLAELPNLNQQDDLFPLPDPANFGPKAISEANYAVSLSELLTALESLEVYYKYAGDDKALQDAYDKALDIVLDKIHKILLNNPNQCLTKDDYLGQAIASRLSNAKPGTFSGKIAKKFIENYGTGPLEVMKNMYKSCVLKLHIKSQITSDSPPALITTPVEGDIENLKFGFSKDRTFLSGKGRLAYGTIQVTPHMPGKWTCDPWIPIHGESVNLTINRLEPVFFEGDLGQLRDFNLTKMSATDDRILKTTVTCIDTSQKPAKKTTVPVFLTRGSGSLWLGFFNVAHGPELEIQDWQVYPKNPPKDSSNNHIYGEKHINNPSFSPGYGTWSEDSNFILTDTSGK
jgi:hypothetical protein